MESFSIRNSLIGVSCRGVDGIVAAPGGGGNRSPGQPVGRPESVSGAGSHQPEREGGSARAGLRPPSLRRVVPAASAKPHAGKETGTAPPAAGLSPWWLSRGLAPGPHDREQSPLPYGTMTHAE